MTREREGAATTVEKIKAGQVQIGDRISLDGVNRPAFTVTGVVSDQRILGVVKAVRLEVVNDAGQGVARNLGINRPVKREISP